MTAGSGTSVQRLDAFPPEVIAGRFEVEREAGIGAMGVVYRARDRQSGGLVALEVLRDRLDPDAERPGREARMLQELGHPGIVRYVDHGMTEEGEHYIAMEWLEGETLEQRLYRLGLTMLEAIELGRDVASALGAAHQLQIVHRHLKPSNLFLVRAPGLAARGAGADVDAGIDGVKVLDFGLGLSHRGVAGFSRSEEMVGTPGYMAPEQARDATLVDARTDVFALGCVLFECLTGRAAFDGADILSVFAKLATEDPPPVGQLCDGAPRPLEALVARMLAKKADARPRDADDVAKELARLADQVRESPIRLRRAPVRVREGRPSILAPPAGLPVPHDPFTAQASAPAPLDGAVGAPRSFRTLGRYALHQEIAAGGMATVHIGRLVGPVGFSRTVAIKRLHPQYAKDPEFVSMFLDEARLAARIRHPNAVSTLDVVALGGEIVLVMDYIQGESLGRLLEATVDRGATVPIPVVSGVLCGVLAGLHAAHQARSDQGEPLGIVHRDVSPQNVLVGVDGVARVVDFGIAKAAGRLQISREGQIKGKLAYMPVEQVRGEVLDRRADVYSASVVLWEALTLQRMFPGDPSAVLYEILEGSRTPPSELAEGISPELDALVMRGLSQSREDRFETALAMADELERIVPPATPRVIAGWVQLTAARTLEDRAALIAEVERSTPVSSASGAALAARSKAPLPIADPARMGAVDAQPETSVEAPRAAALHSWRPEQSVSPEAPASSGRRAIRRRGPYFVVVAILGVIVAVLAGRGRGSGPDASAPPQPSQPADPPTADDAATAPGQARARARPNELPPDGSSPIAPTSTLAASGAPRNSPPASARPVQSGERGRPAVKAAPSTTPSSHPLSIEDKYGI